MGRRISRAFRRVVRVVTKPGREMWRGIGDLVEPILNPMAGMEKEMKEQNRLQAEKEQLLNEQNKQAEAEREKEEAQAREDVMNSYQDTSSALGSLGVSQDQTLGAGASALGVQKKKKK